eukprot:9647682-Prorocentrum_lima.AAC.1
MKAQDLVKKENIHPPVTPIPEALDWNQMKNDHIMNALVTLDKKRIVSYARTRYNIIPDNDQ